MGPHNWYELSRQKQRDVVRLAGRGSRHPDPRVARVADEWAREKLGQGAHQSGSLAQVVFGALLGDGASVAEAVRDHRAAKKIARVAARGRGRG